MDVKNASGNSLAAATRRFLADFTAFAGFRALRAGGWLALGAALENAGLVLLIPIIGIIMGNTQGPVAALPARLLAQMGITGPLAILAVLLSGFAALTGLRAWLQWRRDRALALLRRDFVEARRHALVERIAASSWEQLSGMDRVRINNLIGNDVVMIGASVHFLLQAVVALGLLACQGMLALLISPVLALLMAGLMVVSALVLLPQLARSRALGRETVDANLELAARGAQFFDGLKLAMSQNLQTRFAAEFNQIVSRLLTHQMDFLENQSRARIGFAVLSSLVAVMAILVGFALLKLPAATLIVFVALLARMAAPVTQLQLGAQQFANFLPAYERMTRLEAELRPQALVAIVKREPLAGAIFFRNVSYRHAASKRGVEGLDLVITPGSVTGIAGASGAGKSTFADLLVGLLSPQVGDIAIGGDVLDAGLRHHWRTRTGYVPQENFLFCDSIRRNLAWSDAGADDAAMRAALTIAGAGAVLARLSQGLDTAIGDHGVLLSGGERQKLAIARALLRRAPLLVLDEATNAIDVAAEEDLLQRLVTLPWRPTIVLIAHRPESLALCDRIITFSEGRIVEDHFASRVPLRRADVS